MPPAEPALFRRHPALAKQLPHQPFLTGPSPVEWLSLPGLPDGLLLVKRDERNTPLYGGNKPRKLEFLIGAARARGARRLLTTGGLGTHHGLATTIFGRACGLASTLVLVDQPVNEEVRRSLLLLAAWEAELLHGRHVPGAAAQCLRVLARGALRGERIAVVPTGGSGAVGNVGMVSAAYELADQIDAGELPEPESVWVAVGTGGTQAGLVLGLRLRGLRTRVVGVLVTDILPPSAARLARQARATLRRLRAADSAIPEVAIAARDFPMVRDQLGPGYGATTEAAEQALALARSADLALDTTYTAKCLAALLEATARGSVGAGPALYWNTLNAVDVAAKAPRPLRPEALPRSLRELLGGD